MRNFVLTSLCSTIIFLIGCSENKNQASPSDGETVDQNLSIVNISSLSLEPKEYVQWVQDPDNGLKREKIIDDLIFSVQYKPGEYIICREQRQAQLQAGLVKQKLAGLNGMQYYDLTIKMKSGEGELLKQGLASVEQYDQRVKYFAFAMQNDIQLVEGNDTLPCSLFHFERAYDITPQATFLLGFPVNENTSKEDKTLIIYDKTFNSGLIKLTFPINRLNNLPRLKTL